MSAANSAARQALEAVQLRGPGTRAVPDQAADGVSEAANQDQGRAAVGGRAAKAREELAAVPSQELPGGDSAGDVDMDSGGIDGVGPDGDDDLEGAVEAEEDFDDLEDDLEVADLEIADGPDADLAEGDLPGVEPVEETGRRRGHPRRRRRGRGRHAGRRGQGA